MPSRERSFRAEAVVLRHSDWGEADRLLVLFTAAMGKVRAVAKGVRKLRSRKAGHLEPFTRVNLLLARGRDLLIVTQAETLDAYMPLREGLLLPTYGAYILEVVDRFTFEEEENRGLYRLLVDTLARLSSSPHPELVVRYFEIRLLDLIGFRPQLFQCTNCGEQIKAEDQYFSAEQGGVLCPRCGEPRANLAKQTQITVRSVSMNALKYLRHLQRSRYEEVANISLSPTLNREMENLMQYYLTHLLERKLNTPPFLRHVRGQVAGDGQ